MDTLIREKWNSAGKAVSSVAVTPSDTAVNEYDSLYIGVSGDVEVICRDDTAAVVYKSVPIGFLPVSVVRVLAANTTATNILGLITGRE